jgi:hypothetical protein
MGTPLGFFLELLGTLASHNFLASGIGRCCSHPDQHRPYWQFARTKDFDSYVAQKLRKIVTCVASFCAHGNF